VPLHLPNYFLADLPPEATLGAPMIAEACQTLARNRAQYLAGRSTEELIRVLEEVGRRWLQPDDPFRQLALQEGPQQLGFSRPTLANGLDAFFQQLTAEQLHALLLLDLGHAERLDKFVADPVEPSARQSARAAGPVFLVHFTAGNIPSPAIQSLALGLLVRSAQFVKCARGTSLLPRLFAHSIREADPKLAACLEIAEWKGGRTDLETALFQEADCVTVTGADDTLQEIQHRLPPRVRFLGYGHRVSFGYIAREVLMSEPRARQLATLAVDDVVAWDQLGCLSPHAIYVETQAGITAAHFAQMLAEALEAREEIEPRAALPAETAATIAHRRNFYEVRAAHSPATRLWCSRASTAWTVVYEDEARFQLSCLNRFLYVKPVHTLDEALQGADALRGQVSTVGLAAAGARAADLAAGLARWGVTRICPLGRMQKPPLTWRHDGRPSLGSLLGWSTWEH
jgi:hypothetical protein